MSWDVFSVMFDGIYSNISWYFLRIVPKWGYSQHFDGNSMRESCDDHPRLKQNHMWYKQEWARTTFEMVLVSRIDSASSFSEFDRLTSQASQPKESSSKVTLRAEQIISNSGWVSNWGFFQWNLDASSIWDSCHRFHRPEISHIEVSWNRATP